MLEARCEQHEQCAQIQQASMSQEATERCACDWAPKHATVGSRAQEMGTYAHSMLWEEENQTGLGWRTGGGCRAGMMTTLSRHNRACGAADSCLERWHQCSRQGEVSPMAFWGCTGSQCNPLPRPYARADGCRKPDAVYGSSATKHVRQRVEPIFGYAPASQTSKQYKVFRRGCSMGHQGYTAADYGFSPLWKVCKDDASSMGRVQALKEERFVEKAFKSLPENPEDVPGAKENWGYRGINPCSRTRQYAVDDWKVTSGKGCGFRHCCSEPLHRSKFRRSSPSASPSVMKIFIRICTSGWDSAMEMGIDDDTCCAHSSGHDIMHLSIQPMQVSTNNQCHMFSDSASGLDLPSCDSLGEDWTAQWVPEQQEALEAIRDVTLCEIAPRMQSRSDQGLSAKSEYGCSCELWHWASGDERDPIYKEGCKGVNQERTARQCDKENENENCTAAGLNRQVCAEIGNKGCKSHTTSAGALKPVGKLGQQLLKSGPLQERHSMVDSLPKSTGVRRTSKRSLLSSDETVAGWRPLDENLPLAPWRSNSVPTSSTSGMLRKPQGCQFGVYDENEVAGKLADMPGHHCIPSIDIGSEISSTFSISQREHSKEGVRPFGVSRMSLASTSLWSWFSQTTQTHAHYRPAWNLNSKGGHIAVR